MKSLTKIIIILSIILMTGCGSLPPAKHMKSESNRFTLPELPQAGKAIVYIVRPSNLASFLKFNIFIDNKNPGSEMGYTLGKQYIYFSIEPGEHKILSNAGNWDEINITAHDGEVIFIKQQATPGVLVAWNFLSRLENYEGKYLVKHLHVGKIINDNKDTK